MIKLAYGDEVLWPDHCVQGSRGAAFSDKLDLPMVQLVVRKGYHPHVDFGLPRGGSRDEDRPWRLFARTRD